VTPLEALLRARIAAHGPIPVAEYMALALGHPEHGYYTARDPLGAAGDFVTAPEISQMFGEIIGGWLAQVHADQGAPERFVLAELGPGRGTLMADALRLAGNLPAFRAGLSLWLVETSPVLRAAQAERLAAFSPNWAARVEDLPEGPLFAVANEFFDALPLRQFRRTDAFWQERLVAIEAGHLAFAFGPPRADAALDARFPLASDGTIVEVSPLGEAIARAIGARIDAHGGAALIIDYGLWDGTGDTLQALRGHAFTDPLAGPGEADLTAHVRFRALAEAAVPARASGPIDQGDLLERLGIAARRDRLAAGRSAQVRAALDGQHRRLTDPGEMGTLFKALALTPPDMPLPPGFDAHRA
jgi:NADH dehydrogenase [ubiquinone] 1 alpha subcomplex assembly factor 7